jgi:hypothetical protein
LANPGYQRRYRAAHPEQVTQNRLSQQQRDRERACQDRDRVCNLEKNNSVPPVNSGQSELYVIRGPEANLEKNNSVGRLTHRFGEIYLVVPAGARLEKNNSVIYNHGG